MRFPALRPGGVSRAVEGGATVVEELSGLGPSRLEPTRRPLSAHSRWSSIVAYLVTVFVLVTVNFFLPRMMPGDPISALVDAGAPNRVPDEAIRAELAEHYGLDRPLLTQYAGYLADLGRGDLGVSIRYNVPVAELVRERLPWTFLLISTAMVLAVLIGWGGGIHSGWKRGQRVDRGLLTAFVVMRSFPVFFVGSVLLLVLSVKLGWFPLAGTTTAFSGGGLFDVAHHLALPALVLALEFAASQYLVMRAGMVSELGADYLVLGRAKGLSDRRLKYAHAARNALLPVVTLTALHASFAVTQAILVETVFAYQGMGRLVFEAVSFRDYPTLQACFLVLTLAVVSVNFAADAVNRRLDPRTTA